MNEHNQQIAMHEAIASLPPGLIDRHTAILCQITTGKIPSECNHRDWNRFYNATPAERDEAFLRVKGLWKDTP
jgi:hypothetical protein